MYQHIFCHLHQNRMSRIPNKHFTGVIARKLWDLPAKSILCQ